MKPIVNPAMEFFQFAMEIDPVILKFLEEYYQTRTEPFIFRLVEQGKKEGRINRDLSNEAIRLYIQAIQSLIAQFNLSTNVILS